MENPTCGAWGGCAQPVGHNRGSADIPENHGRVPQATVAVGQEPLEPLASTATVARKRPLPEDALRAELAEAQRSARFWQGQAENWEREHENTVLPYTTKLEEDRDQIRAKLNQIRAIAEEAPEPRGALRRRLLAVLDGDAP